MDFHSSIKSVPPDCFPKTPLYSYIKQLNSESNFNLNHETSNNHKYTINNASILLVGEWPMCRK